MVVLKGMVPCQGSLSSVASKNSCSAVVVFEPWPGLSESFSKMLKVPPGLPIVSGLGVPALGLLIARSVLVSLESCSSQPHCLISVTDSPKSCEVSHTDNLEVSLCSPLVKIPLTH